MCHHNCMHDIRLLALVSAFLAAVPVPALARPPQGPIPLASPGDWVGTNDYPTSALRRENEGTTSFRLTIGADGRPTDCTITVSSGWAVLDEATCRLITERARFAPATDKRGRAVVGSYSNRVRWLIPKDKRKPMPGLAVISALVAEDGSISDCKVESAEGDALRNLQVGPMAKCPLSNFDAGYVDEAGNAVAKRVRYTTRIEVIDEPGGPPGPPEKPVEVPDP